MKVSLKELFSFTPDPLGEDIGSVANAVVANYTLYEKERHSKRSKICSCQSCKLDAEEAEDRVKWAVEMGRYHLSNRKKRRASI